MISLGYDPKPDLIDKVVEDVLTSQDLTPLAPPAGDPDQRHLFERGFLEFVQKYRVAEVNELRGGFSAAEVKRFKELFSKLDTNKNGFLMQLELIDMAPMFGYAKLFFS